MLIVLAPPHRPTRPTRSSLPLLRPVLPTYNYVLQIGLVTFMWVATLRHARSGVHHLDPSRCC